MSGKHWRVTFRVGEILETEFKSKPFAILGFDGSGVSVRPLSRKKKIAIVLTYGRLDALYKDRESIGEGSLNTQINAIWTKHGLDEENQNESQYWALVCQRSRRAQDGESDLVFAEGGRVLFSSSRFERNPKVRKACLAKHGNRCIVCRFDFAGRYGTIGKGFIHVHHLKPLAEVGASHEVKVEDVVPVCANCHAMLHQKSPPYTPQKLRKMIAKAKVKAKAKAKAKAK